MARYLSKSKSSHLRGLSFFLNINPFVCCFYYFDYLCAVKLLNPYTKATEDKNKRLVNIEIEDDVKRLTITGQDEHDQVVMKQELSDDELDNVAGGRISKNNLFRTR